MKLGFLTVPFADWPLEQVARWAKDNGFEALEVACWPAVEGEARRYAGVTHIDVDSVEERADDCVVSSWGFPRPRRRLSANISPPNASSTRPQ